MTQREALRAFNVKDNRDYEQLRECRKKFKAESEKLHDEFRAAAKLRGEEFDRNPTEWFSHPLTIYA